MQHGVVGEVEFNQAPQVSDAVDVDFLAMYTEQAVITMNQLSRHFDSLVGVTSQPNFQATEMAGGRWGRCAVDDHQSALEREIADFAG